MMLALARKQLDKRIDKLPPVAAFARPPRGWLRAIREALGMTSGQLAERLGVAQSRIPALERGEADGTLTIASLERAAQALDCTLVYALLPRQPLDTLVMTRARAVAAERLSRIDQTMRLEDQAIDADEMKDELERLARSLAEQPRGLWGKT